MPTSLPFQFSFRIQVCWTLRTPLATSSLRQSLCKFGLDGGEGEETDSPPVCLALGETFVAVGCDTAAHLIAFL